MKQCSVADVNGKAAVNHLSLDEMLSNSQSVHQM